MFTIKDFQVWYGKSHNTIVKRLIEHEVITHKEGKGNRKNIPYNGKVESFFLEYGKPIEVAKRFTRQLDFFK